MRIALIAQPQLFAHERGRRNGQKGYASLNCIRKPVRLADAKAISLGHAAKGDGRWRIFVFCDRGNPSAPTSRMKALCDFLADSSRSPIRKYTTDTQDVDSVIDLRAIFQQGHRDLDLGAMPSLLLPPKGRYGLRDYEKMYCADLRSGQDIFDMRGIDRDRGCMVVVRPDQYIASFFRLTLSRTFQPSSTSA